MKYQVIHYCHVLPIWEAEASGLTLEEAELKLKELNNKKKYDKTKMECCKYFIQPEEIENN